jgi:hypothetical protein
MCNCRTVGGQSVCLPCCRAAPTTPLRVKVAPDSLGQAGSSTALSAARSLFVPQETLTPEQCSSPYGMLSPQHSSVSWPADYNVCVWGGGGGVCLPFAPTLHILHTFALHTRFLVSAFGDTNTERLGDSCPAPN